MIPAVLAVCCAGCDGCTAGVHPAGVQGGAGPRAAGSPGVEPAHARRARLRGELAARRIEVERYAGTARGVQAARDAAEIARDIVQAGGDASFVVSALRLLDAASSDVRLAGACEAALRAAEIAAEAPDPRGLTQRLADLETRFAVVAQAETCLHDARALRGRSDGTADRVGADPTDPRPDGGAGNTAGNIAGNIAGSIDRAVASVPTPAAPRVGPRARGDRPVRLQRAQVFGRDDMDGVRVVLYFDGVAVYRRSELPAAGGLPRRVVLDLDGVDIDPEVPALLTVERGGLQRVRRVPIRDARQRLAFDLAEGASHRAFYLPRPFRVVLDFQPLASRVGPGRGRRIVLDPGHGGRNPGAKGPTGLRESDVALSLARRTRHALRRKLPGARVILTRDDDEEVSLEERAAIANGSGADVFVSLHLNASHSPKDRGGVSTFVLDTTNDRQAIRLAARENGGEEQDVTDLQVILASLHRKEQVGRSSGLARQIHRHTLDRGRGVLPQLADRGVKRAVFYVLVGATMPAVLLEASFITRPEEEQALRTDAYRAALAEGVAEGIANFLAAPVRPQD